MSPYASLNNCFNVLILHSQPIEAPDEQTNPTHQQTLVEFRLTEYGAETKVCFTESGFEKLEMTAEQKATLIANHTPGWDDFLSSLQRCAQNIPTKA